MVHQPSFCSSTVDVADKRRADATLASVVAFTLSLVCVYVPSGIHDTDVEHGADMPERVVYGRLRMFCAAIPALMASGFMYLALGIS